MENGFEIVVIVMCGTCICKVLTFRSWSDYIWLQEVLLFLCGILDKAREEAWYVPISVKRHQNVFGLLSFLKTQMAQTHQVLPREYENSFILYGLNITGAPFTKMIQR